MSTGSALRFIFISSPPPLTSCTRLLSGLALCLYVSQPGGWGVSWVRGRGRAAHGEGRETENQTNGAKLQQIPPLTATSTFPLKTSSVGALNRSPGAAEAAPPSSPSHFKHQKLANTTEWEWVAFRSGDDSDNPQAVWIHDGGLEWHTDTRCHTLPEKPLVRLGAMRWKEKRNVGHGWGLQRLSCRCRANLCVNSSNPRCQTLWQPDGQIEGGGSSVQC